MQYNCLSKDLSKEGNRNNVICPCVFTNKSSKGFSIVAVYMNTLIETPEKFEKTANYLKKEFEMKDLGKIKSRNTRHDLWHKVSCRNL